MGVRYLRRSILAAAALVALTAAIAGAADTGTISGLVTDQDDQPLNGALVVVEGANRYATTNADGYYVITPVPVGAFEVKVSRIGYDDQVKSGVNVVAGLRTVLSFQLRASTSDEDVRGGEVPPAGKARAKNAGTISGLVTDEDGQPVKGALVWVMYVSGYAATNADGYYSIHFPAGTFYVEASRVGSGERAVGRVNVDAGSRTTLSFQLRAGAAGTTVIATDQIESWLLAEFADLLARPPGEGEPKPWELERHIRYSSVADAGRISGFVTDEDGRPLSGASVVVTGADLFATTDADGYYHFCDVPVGTFDVKASRVGCGEQVESGVKVVAGLRTNLSFQLRSGPPGTSYVAPD